MQRIVLFTFLWLASIALTAQSAAEIRKVAEEALSAFDAPGFAVGVIKDGEVIISEGFGTRTVNKKEQVDGNTLFAIASNTKAFISTAIGKLHQEGKLDIDAPVREYVPYFALYDDYTSNHTTVRDLLCHRVGLGTFSGDVIWFKSEKEADEIIRQIRHLPANYSWRGGYGYSNLMFITAGEVIRSVTGQSWDEYVKENFFLPLGMQRSQTSVLPLEGMSNVATPHVSHRNNEPIAMAKWEAAGAAGGIISSTNDMLKWLDAQLKEGTVNEKNIFPAEVQNHTLKAHNNIAGGKLQFVTVGLGWFVYEHAGKAIVTHGGGYDGMYSRVIMIPEKNVGIVILTNSMTALSSALGNYLRDSFLELDIPTEWLEKSVEREKEGRESWNDRQKSAQAAKSEELPSAVQEQMLGKYNDPLFGDFEVALNEQGEMELRFSQSSALNATLTHWGRNTYRLDWNEPHAWFDFGTVQFLTNNRNEVTGLAFDVPNDDIFFHELHPVKQ